jgi:hypothetical protein
VVVIDPGHGGARREGAHGMGDLLEKTVALQIALKLKAALEDAGATVLLTREDDTEVPLAARALLANENAADLFLSIHCNSMRRPKDRASTRGVETYFLSPDPTDAEARMLAELENGGPEVMPLPRSDDPVNGILADLTLGQARSDSAAEPRRAAGSVRGAGGHEDAVGAGRDRIHLAPPGGVAARERPLPAARGGGAGRRRARLRRPCAPAPPGRGRSCGTRPSPGDRQSEGRRIVDARQAAGRASPAARDPGRRGIPGASRTRARRQAGAVPCPASSDSGRALTASAAVAACPPTR